MDFQEKQHTSQILFALLFLVIIFGGGMILGRTKDSIQGELPASEVPQNPFLSLSLSAKAVFVWDIRRQEVLYALNDEAQLPLASLTKIMTALVAAESAPENTVVAINRESINQEGDSGFVAGERWLLKDLSNFTLLGSSNDGAHALASVLSSVESSSTIPRVSFFIEKMNQKADELGLHQTYFINESGLDVLPGALAGAYGSAHDVGILFSYLLKKYPDIIEATQYPSQKFVSQNGVTHSVLNTNQAVTAIPGIIASKTGFTDLAGGNLAIIFEAGPMYPIAVVVLGSTQEDRFSDVSKLVSATLEFLYTRVEGL